MTTEWYEQPAPYDFDQPAHVNKQRSRGVVRCHCGNGVDLRGALYGPDYAAQCACGQLFNLVGQQLAPRRQWEEADDE